MYDKGGCYKVAAGVWQPRLLKGGMRVLYAQLRALPLCPAESRQQM